MKLLNFSQFISEARLSDHSGTRIDQRIYDSLVVSFSLEARQAMKSLNRNSSDVAKEVVDLIREEFRKRLNDKIQRFEFSEGNRVVVLMEPILKISGKRFPIKLSVSSFDEDSPEIVKTYSGEKICAYIRNNTLTTIKLLPGHYSDEEIGQDFEDHLSRKGTLNSKARVSSVDSVYSIEMTETGEVKSYEIATSSMMSSTVEKDFTLTPGRKIKYFSKLTDSLVEVEIVEVLNKRTYQADKMFKIKTRKEDGSDAMKTLKAGDSIHLPLGSDGGWVNAKVADQLYTIDKRVPNPILRVLA